MLVRLTAIGCHMRELRILFEYIKRGATLSISAPHNGILSELEYIESKE